MVSRSGFGLLEVIVALLIFTVGALGASALTIHAASLATRAGQVERAGMRAASIIAALEGAAAGGQGMVSDRVAEYRWSIAGDSAQQAIDVVAITRSGTDTIRLRAVWHAPPPLLRARP